jgi:geranylgeranylglycerol-phosphate geranylgeranyltransferase
LRLLESNDNKDPGNEDLGRKYIRWIYLGATLGLLVFISMRLLEA